MALSREIIQEIKERADIVQIVGERVALTPTGSGFKGLCPFHGEKTPSFTVNPQRRIFHCFGCGAGGSVIDFVMAADSLPFGEAAELLADRLGIPLRGGGGEASGRQRELEALGAAAEFYREQLARKPAGEVARRYLRERHFGEDVWEAFGLGFAPEGWQHWTEEGRRRGFSQEQLLGAGLIKLAQGTGRAYDLLRNRVVFPIQDERGRCIAFGGRVVRPEDEPKYLNTPETRHYRKSQVLFGLAPGREAIRRAGGALLVEGYLDVIRLHERGFQQAVATCGTSLTGEHLKLLARYAPRVTLLFDGDAAGIRAALRSVPLFLNQGVEARVVTLPEGLDPDDYLVRYGEEALARELERGTPLLEYLVEQTLARQGDSFEARDRALRELVPIIGQVERPAARDMTLRHLADLADVQVASLQAMLPAPGSGRPPAGGRSTPQRPVATIEPDRDTRHQRMLLSALLSERRLLPLARDLVSAEDFADPRLGRLYAQISGLADAQFAALDWDTLAEVFPGNAPLLRELALAAPRGIDRVELWERVLRGEAARLKRARARTLVRRLKRVAGSEEEEQAILQELTTLPRALRGGHPDRHRAAAPEPEIPGTS